MGSILQTIFISIMLDKKSNCNSIPVDHGSISQRVSYLKFCDNSVSSNFDSNDPIMSQFCTCHDSSAVVSCAKSRLDWIVKFYAKDWCILWDLDYELINSLWNGLQMSTISPHHPRWQARGCLLWIYGGKKPTILSQDLMYVDYSHNTDLYNSFFFYHGTDQPIRKYILIYGIPFGVSQIS